MHQYGVQFYNRCRVTEFPSKDSNKWEFYITEDPANFSRPCTMNGLGRYKCPVGSYCGNPYDYAWLDLETENITANPKIFYGVATFNNIFSTLILINQFTSTDDWSSFMYNMMDIDHPAFAVIYSFINIILGNFFIMNLILAVIFDTFTNLEDVERKRAEQKRQRIITMSDNELTTDEDMKEPHEKKEERFASVVVQVLKKQLMWGIANKIVKLRQETEVNSDALVLFQSIKEDAPIPEQSQTQYAPSVVTPNPTGMRKAKTFIDMDQQVPLFPPMHVITEEPVFHIEEGTEKDSILEVDDQGFPTQNEVSKPNFAFPKAQTQNLPVISQALTPFCGNQQNLLKIEHEQLPTKSNRSKDHSQSQPEHKDDNINQIESISAAQSNGDDNGQLSELVDDLNNQDKSSQSFQQSVTKTEDDDYDDEEAEEEQDIDLDAEEDSSEYVVSFDREDTQDFNKPSILSQHRSFKEASIQYRSQHGNEMQLNSEEQEQLDIDQASNEDKKVQLVRKRDKNHLLRRSSKSLIYKYSNQIVHNEYFEFFIQFSIVVNTALQSLDQYPEPSYIKQVDKVNIFFSILFIIEMFLKIIGLGPRHYFRDSFNQFDCFISITALVDLSLADSVGDTNVDTITVLRTFRLLRVFKLARSWEEFQKLLTTMGKTLKDISSFSVVLFLFMYIYSILGMELFAYKAKFLDDETPDLENGESLDQNFDSFLWSFTTVFILLTEDAWSYIYQKYYVAVSGWRSNLYFLTLFILGPRILLNIFLAVLLQNFEDDSIEEENHAKAVAMQQNSESQILNNISLDDYESFKVIKNGVNSIRSFFQKYFKNCFKTHKTKNEEGQLTKEQEKKTVKLTIDFGGNYKQTMESIITQKRALSMKSNKTMQESNEVSDIVLDGVSLNYFDKENQFRKEIFWIVNGNNVYFERAVIFFILLSSVQLALANPLNDPNGMLSKSMYWIDFLTTIVFFIECLSKIIAFGFIANGEGSYLRNPWNMIDFIIIFISIVAISPLANKLQVFKMFRILRALRLISRAEGLRIGLQALVQAIPNVLRIVMMMILFFLIFGIIAISYFKGRYYNCISNDKLASSIPTYFTDFQIDRINDPDFMFSKWDCLNSGAEWVRNYYNFDNMYQTIASLFILANIAGWQDFMFIGVKVTEIDYAWKKGTHSYWVFFFIGFIIFGSFFLLNLFVGVVISSFNRQKEHIGGSGYIKEDEEKDWVEIHLMVLKAEPIPKLQQAQTRFGKICQAIYKWKYFETLIYGCIIFNTFLMTLKWEGMSSLSRAILDVLNTIFTVLFLLEVIIKITATGKQYFVDQWNNFDFFVTFLSILTILLDQFGMVSVGSSVMVIRTFRISKILRLIKKSKSLRHIFKTFIHCLKPLTNIGSLLLLILYMYTIAGVILFGQVKRNGKLTDTLNFETFTQGALALFVISTTDAWTEISNSCLKRMSVDFECITNPTYQDYLDNGRQTVGCGPKFSGILYFYSYFLVMSLILLKLFVAIILQAYEDIKSYENRSFNDDTVEQFNKVWQEIYSDSPVLIKISDMADFMNKLCQESYFKDKLYWDADDRDAQLQYLGDMNLHVYGYQKDGHKSQEQREKEKEYKAIRKKEAAEINKKGKRVEFDSQYYEEADKNEYYSYYLYYEILDAISQRITIKDYVHNDKKLQEKIDIKDDKTDAKSVKNYEDQMENLEKEAFTEKINKFREVVIKLLNSKHAQDILVLKEIQAYREMLKDKWDLNDMQICIYNNEVKKKNPRQRSVIKKIQPNEKLSTVKDCVSSQNLYKAYKKVKEVLDMRREIKKHGTSQLMQNQEVVSDDTSQKDQFEQKSSEFEEDEDQTVVKDVNQSEIVTNNQSMMSSQPLNQLQNFHNLSFVLKTKMNEIKSLQETLSQFDEDKKSPIQQLSPNTSPLAKLFEKQEKLLNHTLSKFGGLTPGKIETPLRLSLQPCKAVPTPIRIDDKDSIHSLFFKTYQQTREKLNLPSFPDKEYRLPIRRPRIKSALARSFNSTPIGLGGGEEELGQQRRRPQSAAYKHNQLLNSPSPQKINQDRQVNSMLQNYMIESPIKKCDNEEHHPQTESKPIVMTNKKIEVSAKFSISQKSPSIALRVSPVKKIQ